MYLLWIQLSHAYIYQLKISPVIFKNIKVPIQFTFNHMRRPIDFSGTIHMLKVKSMLKCFAGPSSLPSLSTPLTDVETDTDLTHRGAVKLNSFRFVKGCELLRAQMLSVQIVIVNTTAHLTWHSPLDGMSGKSFKLGFAKTLTGTRSCIPFGIPWSLAHRHLWKLHCWIRIHWGKKSPQQQVSEPSQLSQAHGAGTTGLKLAVYIPAQSGAQVLKPGEGVVSQRPSSSPDRNVYTAAFSTVARIPKARVSWAGVFSKVFFLQCKYTLRV